MSVVISAVIVNYNAGELLRGCVDMLLNCPLEIEIIKPAIKSTAVCSFRTKWGVLFFLFGSGLSGLGESTCILQLG